MKLFYSPTSPFARKARVVLRLRGLLEGVSEVIDNPFADDSTVSTVNPLGKIPALIADDGEALYDSPVICAYLAQLGSGAPIYPAGEAYWPALRLEALADGIMDAVIGIRLESLRPAEKQHEPVFGRHLKAVRRSLAAAELAVPRAPAGTIGSIATACALGYLDLRLGSEDWRAAHPALAAWYAATAAAPEMVATTH